MAAVLSEEFGRSDAKDAEQKDHERCLKHEAEAEQKPRGDPEIGLEGQVGFELSPCFFGWVRIIPLVAQLKAL